MQALPALQRLFLSNNLLADLASLSALTLMHGLADLTLDGNPVASGPHYRVSVCELSRSPTPTPTPNPNLPLPLPLPLTR